MDVRGKLAGLRNGVLRYPAGLFRQHGAGAGQSNNMAFAKITLRGIFESWGVSEYS